MTFPQYDCDDKQEYSLSHTTAHWNGNDVSYEYGDEEYFKFQKFTGDLNQIPDEERVLACCSIGKDAYTAMDQCGVRSIYNFFPRRSISLFEVAENHALDFLSKRNGWSVSQRRKVSSFSPLCRYACNQCRHEYAFWLVISRDPRADLLNPDDLQEAIAFAQSHGHCGGYSGGFRPSFYGCGAFSAILVGDNARTIHQQLAVLATQIAAERVRYVVEHLGKESALKKNLPIFFDYDMASDHNPRRFVQNNGFSDRFIFDHDLASLLVLASTFSFPDNKKPPIGLNPERFLVSCKKCNCFIIGAEYGSEYCSNCVREGISGPHTQNSQLGSTYTSDEIKLLRETIDSQKKEIEELRAKISASNPIDTVDLTMDEDGDPRPKSEMQKPKSQLAALHDQAQAMAKVKEEALDRAATAERKVDDIMLELECPICFETKEESTALGCGHVMCSNCVKEHASDACPTCRKPVESRIVLYK